MRWICALLVLLAQTLSAQGEGLPDGGVTAAEVAAALKGVGYPADATADRSGEPLIRSSTGKTLFIVHFFECGPELRCGSMQFTAQYRHKFATAATVGAWNRERRFGRAFEDSHGIVWLTMDVETSHGMTTEALRSDVARWISVLNSFETFIAR
jgi:hypothetical protein